MTEVKNGRIIVPIAEADGVARAIRGGQVVSTRANLCAKLERYIGDPRFDKETQKMYKAQLADVMAEMGDQ